ncbi:hypothetical protein HK096_003892 [Nowakowskiella sp. JEL0078]|nr:hypothetical protein HK096_003892 [Nowakowskiella sp. JEL0078]
MANQNFNFRFQHADFSLTLRKGADELSSFPSFLEKISSAAVKASTSTLLNKENIYLTWDGKSAIEGFDQLPNDLTTVIQVGIIINPPGPNPLPFIGNIYDLIPDPVAGHKKLYKQYGPVIKIRIQGLNWVSTNIPEVTTSQTKKIAGFMNLIKEIGGQGLFTTDTDELDWGLAHALLMPAFSPKAMKAYTGEMGHIGNKISKIFDVFASEPKIENQIVEITDWMTNVTFETIGKIGFGFDFGLVDHKDAPVHPFIEAMGFCLNETFERAFRLHIVSLLSFSSNKRFKKSLDLMRETVDEVIQARKSSPHAKDANRDLLGFMLNARDENTNLSLSDDIIRDEVITFLIAGHETTSITLSWLLYELDQHPDVQDQVLKEIFTVFGDQILESNGIPSISQISQLKYLEQCFKEVLRKYPPVKAIQKYCKKDCVLPGGFLVKQGEIATISVYHMQ